MFENVIQLFKNTSNFGIVFETYEVAKEVLKLLGENTSIKWRNGDIPSKDCGYFEQYPQSTCLYYDNCLTYGSLVKYKEDKTTQKKFPVIYFLSSSGELRNLFSTPKCLRRL